MKFITPPPGTPPRLLSARSVSPPAPGTNPRCTRPPESTTPEVARAAFALLEKLDTGRRRPPPSIPKVFRLYCLDSLSAAEVARQCHCSKAAIIRRLNFIRRQTGLRPALLRNLAPQPPSLDDLTPNPKANASRRNLLYADATLDEFPA